MTKEQLDIIDNFYNNKRIYRNTKTRIKRNVGGFYYDIL